MVRDQPPTTGSPGISKMSNEFRLNHRKAAKLTGEQVVEIHALYNAGMTQGALGRRYKVAVNTIGRIVRGESWMNLWQQTDQDVEIAKAVEGLRLGKMQNLVVDQQAMEESVARVMMPAVDPFLGLTPELKAKAEFYLNGRDFSGTGIREVEAGNSQSSSDRPGDTEVPGGEVTKEAGDIPSQGGGRG